MRQIWDFEIFDTYLTPNFRLPTGVFEPFRAVSGRFRAVSRMGATYLPPQVCRTSLPYPGKNMQPWDNARRAARAPRGAAGGGPQPASQTDHFPAVPTG